MIIPYLWTLQNPARITMQRHLLSWHRRYEKMHAQHRTSVLDKARTFQLLLSLCGAYNSFTEHEIEEIQHGETTRC